MWQTVLAIILSISTSSMSTPVKCSVKVRPEVGLISIADDRVVMRALITCDLLKSHPPNSDIRFTPNQFMLISQDFAVAAYPMDDRIIHMEPKYAPEALIFAEIFSNHSFVTPIPLRPRIPNMHTIRFRPGVGQLLDWCIAPKQLGRTSIHFTVRR